MGASFLANRIIREQARSHKSLNLNNKLLNFSYKPRNFNRKPLSFNRQPRQSMSKQFALGQSYNAGYSNVRSMT